MSVLAFGAAIGVGTSYWRAAGKVQTELHAALDVGKQMLRDAIKEIEHAPNPFQQTQAIIDRFSGGRHLKVSLIDTQGARVVSSHLALPENPAPEWLFRLLSGPVEATRFELPPRLKGYSSFLLETDARNEIQELWEDLESNLVLLGGLSLLILSLIYLTLGHELKPLDELRKAFAIISDGNYAPRLRETGPRDVREVSKGFNEMAQRLGQIEIRNAQLQEQLLTVQEEERAQLARDLHDEIGPLLFAVEMDAASLKRSLGDGIDPQARERIDAIRAAVNESRKQVIDILGRLRTGTVEDLGLQAAVESLVRFWQSRQPGLKIEHTVPDAGIGVERDAVAYRVIQESLSNAVRHGRPSIIGICVQQTGNGTARITVKDDGGGLKSEHVGYGLTGMRERVSAIGGALSVHNREDRPGVIVTAELPPFHHQARKQHNEYAE
jgi:two-component system sensor histidine kinase UhpB